MKMLIELLEALARMHGATLKHPSTLQPMAIERNAETDFSRGVLATIYEIYYLASQSPDGRQAICDLGFQPFPNHHQESGVMESRIELQADAHLLLAHFETLKAFLVQSPDKAGEVVRLLFHKGEFRQELLSIRQVPAVRAGELNVSLDLSDAGLELVRALVAGEIEGCGVVE